MALDGWPTRTWYQEFFSALYLVLVSLSQYVPCGDCSVQIFVFKRFQGCLNRSLLIPLPLISLHLCCLFRGFLFKELLDNQTHLFI